MRAQPCSSRCFASSDPGPSDLPPPLVRTRLSVEQLEERCLLSGETIGPWIVRAAPASASLISGGTGGTNWINVVDTSVTYDEAFTGPSMIDDGYANLSDGTVIEMTFATGALVNGPGADLLLLDGRFSMNSYAVSADYDSFATELPLADTDFTSSGLTRSYYYGGTGPHVATVMGATIDLSDLGIPDDESVTTIRVRTTSGEADLLGVGILDPLHAQGDVFLGLEHVATTGLVATFTDEAGHSASNYSATILWGDGTSSSGTVSGSAGSFNVTGTHAYQRQGSYAIAVKISDAADGIMTVAGSYGIALSVEDHAAVQTIQDKGVTWDGSLESTASLAGGNYEISGSGTFTYTLTSTLIDGLYSAVDASSIGAMSFTLSQSGTASTSSFTLSDYALTETGEAEIARTIVIHAPAGTADRTETGTWTTASWSKTGDDTAGTYTIAASLSADLTADESGVYGGLTFDRDETWTISVTIDEEGDYVADEYTETRVVSSLLSSSETGNVYADFYTSDVDDDGDYTITETGAYATGVYTVTITGDSEGGATGTFNNGVASGTTSAGGDPVDVSFSKSANWNTGEYIVNQTITAANATGASDYTDQTASGDSNWTGDATTIIEQSGNSLTGLYLLHVLFEFSVLFFVLGFEFFTLTPNCQVYFHK